MKNFQKISFRLFVVLFVFAVIFSYVVNSSLFRKSDKPWYMQPFVNEDVLSKSYAEGFGIIDGMDMKKIMQDSLRKSVFVLVDAWGVPFDEKKLAGEFKLFDGMKHENYLHVRLANRTRHAEFAELRNNLFDGVFFFGGDSLEYGRNLYVDSLGYPEKVFCQKCGDSVILAKLDSVLQVSDKRIFAVTLQDARFGNAEKLKTTLNGIAEIAKRHDAVKFVVQGTHRPILGAPEIRREYYSRWVPVVILN